MFNLAHFLQTVFAPRPDEKVCLLIDLDKPADLVDLAFLRKAGSPTQKHAHDIFYRGLDMSMRQLLNLDSCDLYAYETTHGHNLELPSMVTSLNGTRFDIQRVIYPQYDIVLCFSPYSALAPLTIAAQKFGFRGAMLQGFNEFMLNTSLSFDYLQVSRETEKWYQALTQADHFEIDFEVQNTECRLFVELGAQEAQKHQGLCHAGPEIVDLPGGEVYFIPLDAYGSFPIALDEDTLALLHVEENRVIKTESICGDPVLTYRFQALLDADPATGVLGKIGFGTQHFPHSGLESQDTKIFGTFNLALGRNDHLGGAIASERFIDPRHALQRTVLFSKNSTPNIQVRQVRMQKHNKLEVIIQDNNLHYSADAPELVEMLT